MRLDRAAALLTLGAGTTAIIAIPAPAAAPTASAAAFETTLAALLLATLARLTVAGLEVAAGTAIAVLALTLALALTAAAAIVVAVTVAAMMAVLAVAIFLLVAALRHRGGCGLRAKETLEPADEAAGFLGGRRGRGLGGAGSARLKTGVTTRLAALARLAGLTRFAGFTGLALLTSFTGLAGFAWLQRFALAILATALRAERAAILAARTGIGAGGVAPALGGALHLLRR